jgi:hypothetical protein
LDGIRFYRIIKAKAENCLVNATLQTTWKAGVMPEINYTVDAKLSNFEWTLIQYIRKVQTGAYGKILLGFTEGKCVQLEPTIIPFSHKELIEMQSTR